MPRGNRPPAHTLSIQMRRIYSIRLLLRILWILLFCVLLENSGAGLRRFGKNSEFSVSRFCKGEEGDKIYLPLQKFFYQLHNTGERFIIGEKAGRLFIFNILRRGREEQVSSLRYVLPQEAEEAPSGRRRLLYISCAQYSEEWNSSLHTHACAELFFITRGHGTFQVRENRFPVAINDLVIVNASVPHTETSSGGRPMEYVVLGVEGLELVTDAEGCALLHMGEEAEMVSSCLRMMTREIREPQAGCAAICQNLLEVIISRLRRRADFALDSAREAIGGPRASRECDQVRRYIDNHFKENLTLDQLAEMAHISKYYLSHTFQKEYQTSPISYLLSRRIRESRFLLRETDHTLSQIAQILGFSSLSYFSQSFRRLEGISPIEYRKLHRKKSAGEE